MKATRMSPPHPTFTLTPLSYRCNKHLLTLGQHIKSSLSQSSIIGYQFGTVGVSDGISMGTSGMAYSLQSRDLIADQVETAAAAHWLDGMVVVPGCDKNMPGVLMARSSPPLSHSESHPLMSPVHPPVGRLNRPGIMVYGGTIRAGSCPSDGKGPQGQLDVVSAFQAYGKYLQDGRTAEAEAERYATIRHACPGPGACGGVSLFPYPHKNLCCLCTRLMSCMAMTDVHSEHDGERSRGAGDDPPWLIVLPRRVAGEA
jgi:Dehydratase family